MENGDAERRLQALMQAYVASLAKPGMRTS
jgi:hypothetical protein